ncbi:4038_t:CDS:1, partial [Funneliformis caledonium]
KAVLLLEACSTTLGDYYLGLAKINADIKKLPLQQYSSFKQDCFDIINS